MSGYIDKIKRHHVRAYLDSIEAHVDIEVWNIGDSVYAWLGDEMKNVDITGLFKDTSWMEQHDQQDGAKPVTLDIALEPVGESHAHVMTAKPVSIQTTVDGRTVDLTPLLGWKLPGGQTYAEFMKADWDKEVMTQVRDLYDTALDMQ